MSLTYNLSDPESLPLQDCLAVIYTTTAPTTTTTTITTTTTPNTTTTTTTTIIITIATTTTTTTSTTATTTCASGCAVECQICNWEVAGSNLGLGYFAPRSTRPSVPPGSVNEYQLRLGRQRHVWLILIADERVGVQVKTVKSLENTCHTWALLRWWFTTKRRYIKCMHLYLYYNYNNNYYYFCFCLTGQFSWRSVQVGPDQPSIDGFELYSHTDNWTLLSAYYRRYNNAIIKPRPIGRRH